MTIRRHASREERKGTVIIVALVCLVVVTAMVGLLLQGTLRARRQLHRERDRRQAELLLDAGLRRAAFKLAADAEYRGETWSLAADEISGAGRGEVTIAASRPAAGELWQLSVVAEYPLGDEHSIRRSRTVFVSSQE